ncbi:MAG: MFS transporter [Acidobacteriota bacterium]
MEQNKKFRKSTPFPLTFWTANTIELFERAAYYSVASFVVIYLNEVLGMKPTFSTFLNGSVLWGLIYFLPILSGAVADHLGFKRTLTAALVLMLFGYLIMGTLPRFWPFLLAASRDEKLNFTIPVVIGIVLIGIGGSVVKPCISGTVQKTAGLRATLGFGIFYMIINIGSILGRTISYFIRTNFGIPSIFSFAAFPFILLGFFIVIFLYHEPKYSSGEIIQKRSLSQAILGIFTVLGNLRFVFFLIVIGGFWFIYIQIYNLIPLYLRFMDRNAPVELYTLVNPVMIVCFQLLVTKLVKKWRPVKSIMAGVLVTTAGISLNIIPALTGVLSKTINFGPIFVPVAGLFIILAIASIAVGEMIASPRIYEYIGSIAPKGQEGLFLGYANLPIAIGTIVGAPIGGMIFERFIAFPSKIGNPPSTPVMWMIVAFTGLGSALGIFIYDRLVTRTKK